MYIYEQSPKKCYELKETVDNLKQYLIDMEMPKMEVLGHSEYVK